MAIRGIALMRRLLSGSADGTAWGRRPTFRPGVAPRAASRGFSFVELLMVVAIISILAALAVPYLQRVKMTAQEKSAQANVRTLFESQALYQGRFQRYGSLDQLVGERLIDQSFNSGHRDGYDYAVTVSSGSHFELTAVPNAPGITGEKAYYVDETGVIRYTEDGSVPSVASPPWR